MNLSTIIGLVMGILAVVGGQVLEGGHIGSILQITAAVIVFGGTLGATILSFEWQDLKKGLKTTFMIFRNPEGEFQAMIDLIAELAGRARKDGILALQNLQADIKDPFLKRGLGYAIDGLEPAMIRHIMEQDLETSENDLMIGAKVFEAAGGYAPTIGILGAVLGLIHVMEMLEDPSKIGGGIAVAFVATVYGVGGANLIFLPISNKIKRRAKMLTAKRNMILQGIIGIQEGRNPRVIGEYLKMFMEEELRALKPAGHR